MKHLTPFEYYSLQLSIHCEECRTCSFNRFTGVFCDEGEKLRKELNEMLARAEFKRKVAA